jgi:hydrogenase maturation protease
MVRVLCFGNLWQGDDGFGIHVGRHLQTLLPVPSMSVVEIGLRSLDALPWFEGCDEVILVDALHDLKFPPGTVRLLATDEILPHGNSCHAFGIHYLLQAVKAMLACPPPVLLIGAVADTIVPFTDTLSRALLPAAEAVADAIWRRARVAPSEGCA